MPGNNLQELLKLLKEEHETDLSRFREMMEKTSISQKKALGLCWYPVEIKESGYGLGDYPFLVLERHSDREKRDNFQPGKIASLFSTRQEADSKPVPATIHFVSGNTMKLIFYADELPDWVQGGKIGVECGFDERSYREMERALKTVLETETGPVSRFKQIFYDDRQPAFSEFPAINPVAGLNDSQFNAVRNMMACEDIMVIHGPPGTGKTTTLAAGIKLLSAVEKNILVCAPGNAAADLLTEKLAAEGLKVVRIGNISRIDENVLSHTPEGILAADPQFKEIKSIRKNADQLRRMATKYKRQFGREEREQRNLLLSEARRMAQDAIKVESYILSKAIDEADAIIATLVGSLNHYLEGRKFRTLVIDEAAQALEPACWIPMLRAERVILAGDPFQLPPTVKSNASPGSGLNSTLIEKYIQKFSRVSLLDVQYRMNDTIMGFPNQYFYRQALKAHFSVARHALIHTAAGEPMKFIDTAGCSFDEEENPSSRSLFNTGEAQVIIKDLELTFLDTPPEYIPSIGIISPYREQVDYLEELMTDNAFFSLHAAMISVNTIDSFQGQERDVIYISLVRSNDEGKIGFLSDYRRMNVAMTRARKKLVIVGDSATIGRDAFYRGLLEYVEKNASYHSAWEYL